MNSATTGETRAVPTADFVITIVLLVVFAGATVLAFGFPFRAGLFPRMVGIAGTALATMQLAALLLRRSRHRAAVATEGPEGPSAGGKVLLSEDEEEERDLEYVFAHASGRTWAEALGWVAGFFLSLWALGLFVTVPLFTISYLMIVARTRWWSAALYAAVAGGILWFAFVRVLHVRMPDGLF